MDIFKLEAKNQDLLIQELSKHVTEPRWELMQRIVEERTRHITLVLEDIYQSHNAAAAIRSCDGLGIQDIHIIENRNKLVLKNTSVSKGADKWLSFHYYNAPEGNNTEACVKSLKEKGYQIGATALGRNSITVDEVPLDKPVAIMIGTEKVGLTEGALTLADFFIELPMYGFTQSYNLSVCAAITLHTLTKRLRGSDIDWKLKRQERREVLLTWFQRCINHWEAIAERFICNQE